MRSFIPRIAVLIAFSGLAAAAPPRRMEKLDRGVVAVKTPEGKIHVSWRLLGDDPEAISFHLERATDDIPSVRITREPISKTTDLIDADADLLKANVYTVRPVVNGKLLNPSTPFRLTPDVARNSYITIPLKTLAGHTPNDVSVGDLDGDGRYELIVKQEMRPRDNSQRGTTGQTKLEAYSLDGKFLWRIDLGRNIREGAHYTQFMVYDLDGDGKAEVVCKTSDGTIDGAGKPIGDPAADHRDDAGFVL